MCNSIQWYTTPLPGKGGGIIDKRFPTPGLITKPIHPIPGDITLIFDSKIPGGGITPLFNPRAGHHFLALPRGGASFPYILGRGIIYMNSPQLRQHFSVPK